MRLFTYQAFAISDSRSNTDTAQYLPDSNAILHYNGRRAVAISGLLNGRPFDQYTIGLFGIEGMTAHTATPKMASLVIITSNTVVLIQFYASQLLSDRSVQPVFTTGSVRACLPEALYIHKQVLDNGLDATSTQPPTGGSVGWRRPLRPASTCPKIFAMAL